MGENQTLPSPFSPGTHWGAREVAGQVPAKARRVNSRSGPRTPSGPPRGFRPRGFHSNGCAGLRAPRDAPGSEVIPVATETSRATAARTGRFRRIAPQSPRRPEAWSAGWPVPGVLAAGHSGGRRRVACVPPLFGAPLGRLRARLRPDPRGARLLEADPSRRGGRLAASRKQSTSRLLLWRAGLCPSRASAFDGGSRGRKLSSWVWFWESRAPPSLQMTALKRKRTK